MIDKEYLDRIDTSFKKILEAAEQPDAREQMETLNAKLLEANFTMSGKPFPTFLKPLFIERRMKEYLAHTTDTIMDCIEKVGDLFFSNPEMEKYFEMPPLDRELARIDPGYPRRVINGRLDAFLSEHGLKFLEFNCDSPCGIGWHDKLIELLQDIPIIQEFKAKHKAEYSPLLPNFTQMIRQKNAEMGGPKEFTVAVSTDWNTTVRYDLELVASYLDHQPGIHAFFWDPREAEYDGKTLRMNGEPVHVVFRDDIRDFTKELERSKPVLDAFRDNNICFINPFSSRVGGLKCVLWFMTDEKSQHLFTKDELKVIRESIPWTRFMKESKTDLMGKPIDLFPYIRANKDGFVLKPNAGYGGFGVTIGPSVTQAEWDSVLEQISRGESWVVQEIAYVPRGDFPQFSPDLHWKGKNININFFAFNGKFGGGIVRVSDSLIINVHQGGGMIPFCYV
ncbi:hypothetical protein JW823_03980 [bacterium]|nr:hypothetical protein [candidate division CSSED10-310 bacterium]